MFKWMKLSKRSLGYLIPTILLVLGALFLYLKTNAASGGFVSSGFKSYGYFTGGKVADNLDIKSVRWHHHDGYERVVLDVYEWEGVFSENPLQKSKKTGLYQIGIEVQDTLSLDGEVSGYRAFSAKMPNFSDSNIMKRMRVFPNDDGTFLFTIDLKRPISYKVFTLKNPARIIIDVK